MKKEVKVSFFCLVLAVVLLVGCQSNFANPPQTENMKDVQEISEQESNQIVNGTKENKTKADKDIENNKNLKNNKDLENNEDIENNKDLENNVDIDKDLGNNEDIENNKDIGNNEKETMGKINNNQSVEQEQIQDDEDKANEAKNEDQENMETKILVYKKERKLELWQNGEMTNCYSIGLAKNAKGRKQKEGDRLTPEGEYYVCTRNQYSKFYLSLGISYPNIEDAQNGLESGLIDEETYDEIENAIKKKECPPWYTELGGEIMIHGHGGDTDWTKGCIAVDDEVMDVLWQVCQLGTLIVIYP